MYAVYTYKMYKLSSICTSYINSVPRRRRRRSRGVAGSVHEARRGDAPAAAAGRGAARRRMRHDHQRERLSRFLDPRVDHRRARGRGGRGQQLFVQGIRFIITSAISGISWRLATSRGIIRKGLFKFLAVLTEFAQFDYCCTELYKKSGVTNY